jgi:hypothetical protein
MPGRFAVSFLDKIREPELKDILLYWLGKRSGRAVPLRKDIGPAGIDPRHLPHLFMYRYEANERFRCVLAGTEIVKIFQRDETGLYLDEILPAHSRNSRLKLFARCVEDQRPVYYAGPALIPTRDRRRVGRLLLPLSSDGELSDHVFGIVRFGAILDSLPGGRPFPEVEEPAVIAVASDEDLQADSG